MANLTNLRRCYVGWGKAVEAKLTVSGIEAFRKLRPDVELIVNGNKYPATVAKSETTIDYAAERKAAEWVRQLGTVQLESADGKSLGAFNAQSPSLPEAPFCVREINLRNAGLDDEILKNLSSCRRIQFVKIDQNPKITAVGLAAFEECADLKLLDLYGTSVGTGLEKLLVGWPRLEVLYTSETQVDAEVLRHFPDCPQLLELHLTDQGQSNDALRIVVEKCPNITNLRMKDASGRVTTEPLVGLKKLNSLELSGTALTEASVESLRQLPQLERVTLENTTKAEQVALLARLDGKLKQLTLSYLAWPDEQTASAYKDIAGIKTEELIIHVGPRPLTDRDLKQLSAAPKLRRLDIMHHESPVRLTTAGIADFIALRPDVHLTIDGKAYPPTKLAIHAPVDYAAERKAAEWILNVGGGAVLVDKDGKELRSQTPLAEPLPTGQFTVRRANLMTKSIDDVGLAQLNGCTKLEKVLAHGNPKITSGGLKSLVHSSTLTELEVGSGVDNGLVELLPSWPNLRHLNVHDSTTTDRLFEASSLPQLDKLQLGSDITDKGLSAVVEKSPLLKVLILSDASRRVSLVPLAKAKNLEHLSCSERHLTKEGIAALSNLASLQSMIWTFPIHDEVVSRLKPLRPQIRRLQLQNYTHTGSPG